jgi:hypothetical protein
MRGVRTGPSLKNHRQPSPLTGRTLRRRVIDRGLKDESGGQPVHDHVEERSPGTGSRFPVLPPSIANPS